MASSKRLLDRLRPAAVRSRPPMAVDRISSTCGEPVQPAGQPRDLAVVAERRIDEAGRADEGAVRSSDRHCDGAEATIRNPAAERLASDVAYGSQMRDRYRCRSASIGSLARMPEGPAVARRRALQRRRRPCGSSPHAPSHAIDPSARTLALQRRLASVSIVARRDQPAFDQQRRTRPAARARLSAIICIALSSSGRVEAIRSCATLT